MTPPNNYLEIRFDGSMERLVHDCAYGRTILFTRYDEYGRFHVHSEGVVSIRAVLNPGYEMVMLEKVFVDMAYNASMNDEEYDGLNVAGLRELFKEVVR